MPKVIHEGLSDVAGDGKTRRVGDELLGVGIALDHVSRHADQRFLVLDQAQADLLRVDSADDLPMLLGHLRGLSSEDDHTCYDDASLAAARAGGRGKGGGGGAEDVLPVPDGWAPMIPMDEARVFRGSRLAPYGANMALVLYRAKDSGAAG